jgi:hypothetical protein
VQRVWLNDCDFSRLNSVREKLLKDSTEMFPLKAVNTLISPVYLLNEKLHAETSLFVPNFREEKSSSIAPGNFLI